MLALSNMKSINSISIRHETEKYSVSQPGRETGMRTMFVHSVFDTVARRYDLMNDLMSGGVHRLWKNAFVSWLQPRVGMTVLDVAGGTGDIACRILPYVRKDFSEGKVIVCDLTLEMLSVGRNKAINAGFTDINWVCGNAELLPFPDRSIDVYTIAFGLRNVAHIDVALSEARRVLKPGGRFLCLEFSHTVLPLLKRLYDYYSFTILPSLGWAVTGNLDAYQYLVSSIRQFPDQLTLCHRLALSGLSLVKYRNLSGGIVAIHSAWRV